MKKKIRNRIASGILALMMGMSSFSGASVTAYANELATTDGVTLSDIDPDESTSESEIVDESTSQDESSSGLNENNPAEDVVIQTR